MPLRVRVCTIGDVVAGQLRGFRVAGVTWPVMITSLDGELIAVPGVCPHDDVSLVEHGELCDRRIVCHVHGYHFDVDTGRCEGAPALHLRRYKITRVGDEIWVDLL